jgi:phosphomannomutase
MKNSAAHIRHNGIMIDASFNKEGSIAYYVVECSNGRFYSLDVAKEIADAMPAGRPWA